MSIPRKGRSLVERRFAASVFCGGSTAVALLLFGCSEDKMPVRPAPQPDSGPDVFPVLQHDSGPDLFPTVPQPDGGLVIVPATCQVQTQAAAPYPVTFRLRNVSKRVFFRYLGCTSELEIASCASSYSDQLASRVFCPCDCLTNSCPTCGACYDDGLELAPGAMLDETWTGLVPVTSTSAGRSCQTWKAAPAGRYRVRLPLYASVAEAKVHAPTAVVVTADFELPALTAGGVINMDVNP